MPYKDPEKRRSASASYYQSHKKICVKRVLENNAKIRKRSRDLIEAAKAKPCADCGKVYPSYVMDFDHLPGFEKRFELGRAVRGTYSIKSIEEEIAKCEVVCANCHRERTFGKMPTAPSALP